MVTRALMFQGTGSDVGKSMLVAGMCRVAARRGIRVAPFKPQNMSNNAAVCPGGGEIGRAQALQARAAGLPPSPDMNPVLLKPQSDVGAQVVVQGRLHGTFGATDYEQLKRKLRSAVFESFQRLSATCDLVLVEGAGSPAEINLRGADVANMGFALPLGVPVALVGDIDRGGVIAALVGTAELLSREERALVAGFIINKFRGDPVLFEGGLRAIEARTAWHCYGVLPFLRAASRLPAEDAVALERTQSRGSGVKIAVPMLSRISNFDDFDPLALEPGVDLVMVPPGEPLPGDARLVILPGTKATLGDLRFFRAQGWHIDLEAHVRRGGEVLGICGGYQMLGQQVSDPKGVEGAADSLLGLGYLRMETILQSDKRLSAVQGHDLRTGLEVRGFEMHVGRSSGDDCARPVLQLTGGPDGASDATGRVRGCYVHGLFANDAFRSAFLDQLGARAALGDYEHEVEQALDAVADAMEAQLDVDALLAAAAPI